MLKWNWLGNHAVNYDLFPPNFTSARTLVCVCVCLRSWAHKFLRRTRNVVCGCECGAHKMRCIRHRHTTTVFVVATILPPTGDVIGVRRCDGCVFVCAYAPHYFWGSINALKREPRTEMASGEPLPHRNAIHAHLCFVGPLRATLTQLFDKNRCVCLTRSESDFIKFNLKNKIEK